jgi:hypothetical protein
VQHNIQTSGQLTGLKENRQRQMNLFAYREQVQLRKEENEQEHRRNALVKLIYWDYVRQEISKNEEKLKND